MQPFYVFDRKKKHVSSFYEIIGLWGLKKIQQNVEQTKEEFPWPCLFPLLADFEKPKSQMTPRI